jgi:hypothetical protein
MTTNRIDPTPVRISTNLDIGRQTPKSDFGDRVNAGLNAAGNAIASGAAVVAPLLPGGPILSAAVSSVGSVTGGAPGSVGAQYSVAGSGVTNLGGSLSTTVGGTGLPTGGDLGAAGGTLGGTFSGTDGSIPIQQAGVGAGATSSVQDMAAEEGRLLSLQIAMQNENQAWSTVSNVLKVRHDTVKNTIQNVHS